MHGGQHFDWRSLGKADYSQAAALVASLPEEHREKLVNGVRETLTRIVYLSWRQSEHSGQGAAYCWPSESWLAKAIGKSERTVRRCLATLREAGLLEWRRRTTKGGAWTSNLYQVGKTFLATLFARKGKKVQQIRDRTKMADNDLKREYKADVAPYVKPFVPPEWMMHRVVSTPTLVATGSNDTAWGEEERDPNAERKALLKQQAAALKARGL